MRRACSLVAALITVTLCGMGPASAQPVLPSWPFGGPVYTVSVNKPTHEAGRIHYTTGSSAAAVLPGFLAGPLASTSPSAAVITDRNGHEVWRHTPPPGHGVSNFRVQSYQGKPVYTWWQGSAVAGGHGAGVDYIADEQHRIIKTLTPGGGLSSDVHEFRLTPDGRALITSYPEVSADLTAIGGPRNGRLYNCVASVVDVATGKTLFRWDALSHVPLTDTTFAVAPGQSTYDPYHMNSISLDPRGNLVISLRNTSTVYNVDPSTGAINWQIGGKRSSLALGPGVAFAFQHDAEFSDPTTLRLFNNNSSGLTTLGASSVQWIRVDPATKRATLVRNQTHPDNLVSFAMGNAQELPNGNTIVSWGIVPRISEFAPSGELLYDATPSNGSYRAYLY